jgi:pyruvate dehydrogenase E2 component (dihydrolipoamide acetyltransferase)/2-oxoisovalerate dehydrogenase E2 component (dihydrolipoyl transacylase)
MEFRVPELGEGVYEAELVAWLVKPGDTVKRGQSLMEVLTDKATMEVPSPFAGTITAVSAEPGQQIKVGDVVLSYTGTGQAEEPAIAAAPPAKTKSVAAHTGDGAKSPASRSRTNGAAATGIAVKAAPSVRLLARKMGIDLGAIRGTGPQGRVLLDDLSAALKPSTETRARPRVAIDFGTPGARIKVHGLRRKIADHMVQSKRTVPHYSYVDECDATRLVQLRADLRPSLERAGVRLTYLAFLVRAAVRALKEVPLVNATLDEQANEIILHDRYHIGIAVAAPGGLIVPVVHDADKKDFAQIARDVERLGEAARTGKSQLEDLRGSTFTVTSIGNIGGLISTPVINLPNVGIMGVGRIVKRPVYDDAGNIRPADMLYLSFSFDHRVVDGAVGAHFGNAVRYHLEHPAALLMQD